MEEVAAVPLQLITKENGILGHYLNGLCLPPWSEALETVALLFQLRKNLFLSCLCDRKNKWVCSYRIKQVYFYATPIVFLWLFTY